MDRVLTGEMSVEEFEQWIYSTPELEAELGAGAYLDLLAFNYRRGDAVHALRTLVESTYSTVRPGRKNCDRAFRLACGLITGDVSLVRAARELAILWYAGEEWIPIAFVGIDSELDDVPLPEQHSLWEPAALERRLTEVQPWLDQWRAEAVSAARDVIESCYPGAACA